MYRTEVVPIAKCVSTHGCRLPESLWRESWSRFAWFNKEIILMVILTCIIVHQEQRELHNNPKVCAIKHWATMLKKIIGIVTALVVSLICANVFSIASEAQIRATPDEKIPGTEWVYSENDLPCVCN